MGRSFTAFVGLFLVVGLSHADLPVPAGFGPLKPVSQAPEALQKAARAIVRVGPIDGYGTGFFLAGSGYLVTNAHVIGPSNCSREGCFFDIDFALEHGAKADSKEFFGVPVLTIPEGDVTVLEIFEPTQENPRAKKFKPEAGLEIADPAKKILDVDQYIVGHAFGGLKRWSKAPVYRRSGDWCSSTHCVPSGSSGSPVLDEEGKIVGIVHRSNDFSGETTDLGLVRHSARFTVADTFAKLLSRPTLYAFPETLKGFTSIPFGKEPKLEETEEGVGLSDQLILVMASRKLSKLHLDLDEKKTIELPLIELVLEGCQTELEDAESAADPSYDYPVCSMGRMLIDCKGSDKSFCPTGKARKAWTKAFTEIAEYRELNNQTDFLDWYLAPAMDFASSDAQAATDGRKALLPLLAKRDLPKLEVLAYLSMVSQKPEDLVYEGTDYLALLENYSKQPYYPQYFEDLITSITVLTENETLSLEKLAPIYSALLLDPKLPVELKSDLESHAYEYGVAPGTKRKLKKAKKGLPPKKGQSAFIIQR